MPLSKTCGNVKKSFLICILTAISGLLLTACSGDLRTEPATNESPLAAPSAVEASTGFIPPDSEQRTQALGPDAPSFFLTMRDFFEPIRKPESGDWLAEHQENGQSYPQYEALEPNVPKAPRDKIFLQPLGKFSEDDPSLVKLQEYTSLFFGLDVVLLDGLDDIDVTSRIDMFTKKKQWLTSDILNLLEKKLPADAYCLLGVTMVDLYPDENWNYVFGIATLKKRVGVYSLARYDPHFFGDSRGVDWETKALERSCKVLSHETGHMMGMAHCVYYDCLMNGSNNLGELDTQSTFLCPVCLRKLQRASKPNFVNRYRLMREFFEKNHLNEQQRWVRKVLQEAGTR